MTIHVTRTDQTYNDEQYAKFHALGWLFGLFTVVDLGCKTSFDSRLSRFDEANLNDRVKGDDRWTCVDQELIRFADRFGFDVIWVATGRGGHPRMLMIKKDNLIISAHQIPLPARSPRRARHREALMPLAPGRITYTLDEIVHMLEHDGSEYWTLTYQQTSDRVPHWIILGRPALGQKELFYSQNILTTLGIVHSDEEFPNFNPVDLRPKQSFILPEELKREREGEQ